ncbi:MAG: sulfate ABC transporter substrate-binding protein [Nitrososphaeraceae archaeon]|nr:sulfate ABC transporter substrate-binding protein [Nitrososphaeraceae archaeon]
MNRFLKKNNGKIVFVLLFLVSGVIFFQHNSNFSTEVYGQDKRNVNIGYFPNINHAQAVIGFGDGSFQKNLGENVNVKTYVFNAGPSALEALFAKQVDMAYVGPSPAINGYVVSKGEGLKIVAGAASGGVVFVVRNDSNINGIADFDGKKFSSPQLGNTQDVSLKTYLLNNGYKTKDKGGTVVVLPLKNADIFILMQKGNLDGAWVAEPWGEKLISETKSKLFLDERDLWPGGKFTSALIIVRSDFLQNNQDIVKKVLETHVNLTNWINQNKEQAYIKFNDALHKLTGQTLPENQLIKSFERLELTYLPLQETLYRMAEDAFNLGFFKTKPDLSQIFDLTILDQVLEENQLSNTVT